MGDVFDAIVGQPALVADRRAAVPSPVHAYLLLGPAGAGARTAATALSAALLCANGGCGECRDCRLALAGEHPDALTFVPQGASLLVADAEEIIRIAMRSPVEGPRKVIVLTEMHRVDRAAPLLLQTTQEPPPSAGIAGLAAARPPELVAIA